MEAQQCAVIAQVIPVFVLVLAVERGIYVREAKTKRQKRGYIGLVAGYAVVEAVAVSGAAEGLHDVRDGLVTVGFGVLLAHVVLDLGQRIWKGSE